MTHEEGKAMVGLLRRLDGWPGTTWERAQLCKAIMQHCPTVEHARRTLTACLTERRICPSIDEVIATAKSLSWDTEAARRREECEKCKGVGYVGVSVVDSKGQPVEAVRRCVC